LRKSAGFGIVHLREDNYGHPRRSKSSRSVQESLMIYAWSILIWEDKMMHSKWLLCYHLFSFIILRHLAST